MLFREHRPPSRVLTLGERNAASIEKIQNLNLGIAQASSPDERYDLYDQKLEEMRRYDERNGLAEERPTIASKIGRTVVNRLKSIPDRIMYPG